MSTLSDYLTTHPFGDTETPPSPVVVGPSYQWLGAVDALRSTGNALEGVSTTSLIVGSRVDIYIGGVLEAWFITTGAADGTDLTGQVAPLDYNAVTNNKHWVKGL